VAVACLPACSWPITSRCARPQVRQESTKAAVRARLKLMIDFGCSGSQTVLAANSADVDLPPESGRIGGAPRTVSLCQQRSL
jgi:hypothetical protein